MPFKTVLFDLDGTLTDSAPGIINSLCHAFDRLGEPEPDVDLLRAHFIGPPLDDSFVKYYGFSKEKAWQGVLFFREYFNVKGYLENSLYPGIKELLARLKAEGVRMAVATSKPEVFARKILEHFEIAQYFDYVGGATPDRSRIRKNDIIFYVLDALGNPDRDGMVMIGDREHDVFGAKAASLPSIGVLYGYGSREELESAGATYIAETVDDVFTIVCGK